MSDLPARRLGARARLLLGGGIALAVAALGCGALLAHRVGGDEASAAGGRQGSAAANAVPAAASSLPVLTSLLPTSPPALDRAAAVSASNSVRASAGLPALSDEQCLDQAAAILAQQGSGQVGPTAAGAPLRQGASVCGTTVRSSGWVIVADPTGVAVTAAMSTRGESGVAPLADITATQLGVELVGRSAASGGGYAVGWILAG
jgi:hypothetical protein